MRSYANDKVDIIYHSCQPQSLKMLLKKKGWWYAGIYHDLPPRSNAEVSFLLEFFVVGPAFSIFTKNVSN